MTPAEKEFAAAARRWQALPNEARGLSDESLVDWLLSHRDMPRRFRRVAQAVIEDRMAPELEAYRLKYLAMRTAIAEKAEAGRPIPDWVKRKLELSWGAEWWRTRKAAE